MGPKQFKQVFEANTDKLNLYFGGEAVQVQDFFRTNPNRTGETFLYVIGTKDTIKEYYNIEWVKVRDRFRNPKAYALIAEKCKVFRTLKAAAEWITNL